MSTSQSNGLNPPVFPPPPPPNYYHGDPRMMLSQDDARFFSSRHQAQKGGQPQATQVSYHHTLPNNTFHQSQVSDFPGVPGENRSSPFGLPRDYKGSYYQPVVSSSASMRHLPLPYPPGTFSTSVGHMGKASEDAVDVKPHQQASAFLRYPPIPPQRHGTALPGGPFSGVLTSSTQPRPSPPILPNASGRVQGMVSPLPPLTAYQPFGALPSPIRMPQTTDLRARQHPAFPSPTAFPGPQASPASAPFRSTPGVDSIAKAADEGIQEPPPNSSPKPSMTDSNPGVGVDSSTEEEVQKLLSIALTNNQQRVEKTVGQIPGKDDLDKEAVDVVVDGEVLNLPTAYVGPQLQSSEQTSEAVENVESSSPNQMVAQAESASSFPDTELASFEKKEANVEVCNLKQEAIADAEWERSLETLEISLETKDAMESSGSPTEVCNVETAEDQHDPNDPAITSPSDHMSQIEDSNQDCSNMAESERMSPDSDDGMTMERFELFTSRIQPDKAGLFFCHLCEFTGKARREFHDHLLSHYDYKCPKCDYTSRTEGRLKRHLNDFHSDVPPKNFSGKITRVSKPKTLRCKQCEFVAASKDDYWQHQRTHIKEEKRLDCPRCPFVTEYKHHLEYHIRNHFGSKPYRCDKCNYNCVNKSMLNSHMKSHTNVYQYRCADCQYATKYCHSLKLHLAKNSHNPATVLNADGSLPEYDNSSEILNMKRGPPRGTRPSTSLSRGDSSDPFGASRGAMLGMPTPPPPRAHLMGEGLPGMPPGSFFPSSPGMTGPPGLWSFLPQHMPGFPMLPHFNLPAGMNFSKMPGFPSMLPQGPNASLPISVASMVSSASGGVISTEGFPSIPRPTLPQPLSEKLVCALCNLKLESVDEVTEHLMKDHCIEADAPFYPHLSAMSTKPAPVEDSVVLDLSRSSKQTEDLKVSVSQALKRGYTESAKELNALVISNDYESSGDSPNGEPSEGLSTNEGEDRQDCSGSGSYGSLRKRPRKSKAVRLDKMLSARFQTDDVEGTAPENLARASTFPLEVVTSDVSVSGSKAGVLRSASPAEATLQALTQRKETYDCQHCDITFKGRTLFDIHMGYHCHADPFLCNRCGRQSQDKVAFFTHLYEMSHA